MAYQPLHIHKRDFILNVFRVPTGAKEQVMQQLPSPSKPSTDTIIKHIHLINEKKDVGLQLSNNDLPASSANNKSAQTRWTSTKSHPTGRQYSKDRHFPKIEISSSDDPQIASYQPPPLYFNSNCDFLQMMTPANAAYIDGAKENRLSYLASIPIDNFNDEFDNDEEYDEDDDHTKQRKEQLPKSKSPHNVRFNLPSSSTSTVSSSKGPVDSIVPKKQSLSNDFLHNFPLLRALVEEALALQEHQQDIPMSIKRIIFNDRPHSAKQQGHDKPKSSVRRPKSATNNRTSQVKSLIVPRNINNNRRLYPPSTETRQMMVTKTEVRNLVDRLSQPKFNKRLEREIASAKQTTNVDETIITPRLPPKSSSIQVNCHLLVFL